MKRNIFLVLLLVFFYSSCSKEEFDTFNSLEKRIQNDGFFPLAQSNSWVYENRSAEMNGLNYIYDSDFKEVESSVISSFERYEEGKNVPRFDYNFSPYNFGSVIGGVFGGLNQISKIDGEYFKKQKVSITNTLNNGKVFKDFKLEFDDQKFFEDPIEGDIPIAVFDTLKLIGTKKDKFTSPDGGIIIEYTVRNEFIAYPPSNPADVGTKVRMVMPTIDPKYASDPNVDSHLLRDFSNVAHTKEITTIDKIILTDSGNNRLVLNATVQLADTGTSIIAVDLDPNNPKPRQRGANLNGVLKVGPEILGYGVLANIWVSNRENLRLVLNSNTKLCESNANIKINTVLKGNPMNFVANEVFMEVDSFWAKGVGNIKNITSYKEFYAKVNAKDYLTTDPFKIFLNKVDPNCGSGADDTDKYNNTLGLSAQLRVLLEGIELDIPFILSDKIVIQNLKKFKQRKTLN